MSKLFDLLIILYMAISIALPILKFSGVIALKWWIVLCPLWIPLIFIYILAIAFLLGMMFSK